jgi:hypothetical protein
MLKILNTVFIFILLFVATACNYEKGETTSGLIANHQNADGTWTVIAPSNGNYAEASIITLRTQFDYNVTVTGTPQIELTLDSGPVFAQYVSGSGTTTLTFQYTVAALDSSNGISNANSIDFNGGDITYNDGASIVSAPTAISANTYAGVVIDTGIPSISSVDPLNIMTPATYYKDQDFSFRVTFTEDVDVTGIPQIPIDLDGTTVMANYNSGSGTNALIFKYQVASSDVDTNGITIDTPLNLNGGSIKDSTGNDISLTVPTLATTNYFFDGDTPYVTNITPPANNTYFPGELLEVTYTFSENVIVTGTPQVDLIIGGDTVTATYASGSNSPNLVFQYAPITGDEDTDGIEIQSIINPNGGRIEDTGSREALYITYPPTTPGVLVDATLPVVTSITPPTDGTYEVNDEIVFIFNFNVPVNVTGLPQVSLNIENGGPLVLDYSSGSGSTTIVFRKTVSSGEQDLDGVILNSTIDLNGGIISGAVNGVTADLNITDALASLDTSNVFIDAKEPQIIAFTSPADQNYATGMDIDFIVSYDEPVTVSGSPRIAMDIGGVTRYATYSVGSGTGDLTFRYTVDAADLDDNGIVLPSTLIELNAGTIQDGVLLNADLDFTPYAPDTSGIKVNYDPPLITSVDPPVFQYYNEGDVLGFTVNTNVAINVNGGTPRIQLDIGGQTQYATLKSGNGTTALYFDLTLPIGLEDHDGILMISPIDLNGSTMRDGIGNNLDLTYTLPDTSGVFVDSIIPFVASITPPANNTYILNEDIDFTLNYNETINIVGTPRLLIDIGGVQKEFNYVSGTGTDTIIFRYTVIDPDEDLDGISFVGTDLDLNGATITDIGGNNSDISLIAFSALPNISGVLVDGIIPLITGVTPPLDNNYILNDNLDFVVAFDDNITITNTPRLQIALTTGTVYADYQSGSGTSNITFRYTVGATDEDLDGINLGTPVDLNITGLVQDNNGNNADLTFLPPVTSGINVDGIVPTVTIDATVPIDATNAAAYTLTGTCSEETQVVNLDIGGITDTPTCTGGIWSSTLNVSALPESADNTVADISITADHDDSFGNGATQAIDTVIKDTVLPIVSSNTIAANTYIIGDQIDLVLTFSEDITSAGSESVDLTIGASTVSMTQSASTANTITYSYTVLEGELDTDGLANAGTITIGGGSIVDNVGNALTNSIPTTAHPTALVDGVRPVVTGVSIAANTYYIGDDIDIIVTFDDTMSISGSPEIPFIFETEVADPKAIYNSGTGSNSITFRYNVVSGNEDLNGANLVAAIVEAGGTLQDPNGNDAVLTLSTTSFPAVIVDAIVPEVTIDPASTITASNVTAYNLTGTCSEDTEAVNLNIGGVSDSATCTGGTWSTTTNVSAASESADNTVADVTITADHSDAGGNPAIQATTDVIKDTTLPTVSSNTIAANTYIIGDQIDLVLTFSEDITSAGSETVDLTIGGSTVSMTQSASTANSITYSYTVLENDLDTDGLANAATITIGAGSIVDTVGNTLTNSIPTIAHPTALVDGVRPVVSNVTIAANTYYASDTLSISVQFDDTITVAGGTPDFALTFSTSAGSPTAAYTSGTGSNTLVFEYTVLAGNEDTDGIDLAASINAAGATLQDPNGNDATLTLSPTNFAAVLIDAIQPEVTIDPASTITASNVTTYNLTGTCTEDIQAVNVNIGGVSDSATCTGGTWSTTTNVSAASESADNTVADIAITADHSDAGGNPAIQATTTVIKDATLPTVSSNTIAANTYIIGDQIDLVLTFSEDITSAGSETIDLTIGAGTVSMTQSASTANTITYSYTVLEGELDTDGLTNAATITIGAGSIVDTVGNTLTNSIPTIAHPTALVDGVRPVVSNVTIAPNTYYATETLSISVQFDDTITVAGGTPDFALTFGTSVGSPTATYQSGTGSNTLVFEYTVLAGNEDTDGIDLPAAINAAGATLQDPNGNDANILLSTSNFPAVFIDAIQPEVTIDPASTIFSGNVATYNLTGTCSEDGQAVNVNIGGITDSDTCAGGTWSTTTNVSLAPESADTSIADVTITADHSDAGGNPAIQATTDVIKDTTLPNPTVNAIAANTYIIGDTLNVTVDFAENVTAIGVERIALTFETMVAAPIYADYSGGTGTTQLTFSYTIQEGDEDLNGVVSAGTIDLNTTGAIMDMNGNESNYALSTTSFATALVDGVRPVVSNVTIAPNTYYASDTLSISVQFDDTITVAGGTPDFALTFGTSVGSPTATYQSGTGSNTLVFEYTVLAGNEDTDGIDLALAINAAGATLQDPNGNDATLTLSPTNFAAVLIDAIQPEVTIDPASTITASNVTTYNLTGTCSEDGEVVNVNIGGVADTATCGTGTWSTTTDVALATDSFDNTVADVNITADHSDAGGNPAIQATTSVIKDATPSSILSNTANSGTLTTGETITLTVNYDEDVNVTGGVPFINITLNSGVVQADYVSGSGSSALIFEYDIISSDSDSDGIVLATSISANGATLEDNVGNTADLNLATTSHPATIVEQTVTLTYADPSAYDFGQRNVGSSTDITMIINYTGTIDATSVNSSNPSAQFNFKGGSFPGTGGTCSATVSGNCTIVLTFTPDSATVFNSTVSISYNNGAGPVTIDRNISGEGISTTPTKVAALGPTGIITGDCIPLTIEAQTADDQAANVSGNENISLVVNNGTGTFYSNDTCTTTTTTRTIANGTSSIPVYFQTATPGQELTLVFNAATLDNTTKVVISSNEPVDLYANASAEIETDQCTAVEVSLLDANGVKTGSSSAQTVNLAGTGDVEFFSDAFCTGSIAQVNFAAYEDSVNIYVFNATAETVNFTFTDAGATLTTYNTSTDFVSNLTWWDTNWLKRKKLTISNLDQATTHSNMPVLVKLSSSRINYSDLQANGEDIRFTLDDHTTVLNHSIEEWNSSGNSFVWVRLPSITASSEVEIFMYYDNNIAADTSNTENVFTSYEAVWNMDKNGATYIDSTSNNRDGTAVGTVADQAGPIGNSIYVNGSSRIDLTYNLAQILGRTSTLSFWVRTTQTGDNTDWRAPGITGLSGFNAGQDLFYSFLRADGRIGASAGGGTQIQSNFIINDSSWRHVTVSRNETSGQVRFYVNGVLNGNGNSGTGNKNQAFYCLGATRQLWGGGGYIYFDGSFDSMRMNSSVLSDAAVKANFKYQNDTHVTYGQLEEL